MEHLLVFTTPDAWITFLILIFLEMVLGIDNLVFIAITTDRLPESKKKLGRRFGLGAALVMRILFLSVASWLVQQIKPLFYLPFSIPSADSGISVKDLILFVGGAYLIYKGIVELREKLSLKEEREEHGHPEAKTGKIGLAQAVATIAVMDIVFSIDSVITAVGLSGMLLVMIGAVMIAVFVMIIFADPISEFINSHPEMKILALMFIILVGVKLIIESLEVELMLAGTHVDVLDIALYSVMGFSLILTLLQMTYSSRLAKMHEEIALHRDGAALGGEDAAIRPSNDHTPSQ